MARKKVISLAMAALLSISSLWDGSLAFFEGIVANAKADLQAETEEEVVVDAEEVDASDYGLCDNIQDGTILHCFDWKYTDIKEELPNIAAAGFTSVQTSPAQKGDGDVWYWLYQPQTFSVQPNALGTKAELQALCDEAEKYGINVIVDVVANHTRSIGDDGLGSECYHNDGNAWYTDRYGITHGNIAMTDLNSESSTVQNKVKSYIEELKSLGVDGIRWDAATHISLPSEDCQFWPAVTSVGLYNYGDILEGMLGSGGEDLMIEYTKYMSVTDSKNGQAIREAFENGGVPSSIGNWSERGVSKNKLVYWSESHDSYSNSGEYGEATQLIAQNKIDRAYAIVAGQGKATSLYFSRPYQTEKQSIKAGDKGSTHFTSPEVAAVNHLHNACAGEKDCYVNGGSAAAVCRETGAVIVKGSGSGQVTIENGGGTTAPGTYIDEVSGGTWTVTESTISGSVGVSGIAVIYEANVSKEPTETPTVKPTATPTVKTTATPTTAPIETSQPTISPTETPTTAPTAAPESSSDPVQDEETLKDGQFYVYFECDGGVAVTNKIIVTCGTTYGVLPTPSKIGYSFLGWYTDRTDGEKITTDTIVNLTSNQTLYARWKQQSYNVNFDANGGTADTGNKTVAFGDVYGTLPIPQKENEIFLGWYTQKEDGNLITERSIVSTASNHTLYAHWGGNEKKVNFESLAHSFANSYEAFADEEQYQIPLERYQYIWGDTIFAKKMYDRTGSSTLEEWNGNSFGMAAMSVLLYMGDAELTIKDFNSEANQIKDLTLTDMSRKFQMTLEELIESIDTIKVDAVLQKNCQLTQNRLNDLCTAVKEVEEGKKAPVVLVMSGKQGSHAVVAYKIEGNKMFVYDPDFPAEERTIAVTQDSDGTYTTWSYKVKDAYNWGSADVNSSIGYIVYEDYKEVWSQRTQSSYNQKNLVTLSTQNAVIYNEKNEMVATITDGVLNSNQEEIFVLQNMSFQNTTKDMAFYLPVGTYTILNLDSNNGEFTADIVDVNQAATITTEASRLTFTIDDQKKMNRISCEVAEGQKYQIVLESSLSDDNKNVKITGTGTVSGEAGICQSAGEVNIIDGNISSVTVDEQEKSICEISSGSSAGGTILLQGAQKASSVQKLLNGEKATYIMQPEEGYVLADVLVDGQSQGAVPVYTFENITTTHKIVAVFAKFDAEAITVDKIGTKTHTGKAITPAVTVRMGDVVLKENIDYKVEYSNNKNVGTATVKITGLGSYKQLKRTEKFTILAAKGESYTVGSMKYQVTNSSKKEVMFVAPVSKKKTSVTIPKTVKIGTATYKVTKIAAKAFKGCSKLKKITVKSTYLTSVGSQAFKGIAKNAVIKVPSAKLTKYKKLMKNKGQKKTVKITK